MGLARFSIRVTFVVKIWEEDKVSRVVPSRAPCHAEHVTNNVTQAIAILSNHHSFSHIPNPRACHVTQIMSQTMSHRQSPSHEMITASHTLPYRAPCHRVPFSKARCNVFRRASMRMDEPSDDALLSVLENIDHKQSQNPFCTPEKQHIPKALCEESLEFPLVGREIVSKHARLDGDAARSWVFPTSLAEREYQFIIVRRALTRNTMVCLPTGLGKTFIAAVVMLNFTRWYPDGLVVFMAPTRPLVHQQMRACYEIAGIPTDSTAELTGTTRPELRRELWRSRHVFFLTPQVMP